LLDSLLQENEMNKNVIHDEKENRFYIKLSENPDKVAELLYSKTSSNSFDFFHTEVPAEYRGRGLAGVLAREAFDYIVQEQAKVFPSCSYLRKYYSTNLTESEQQRHVEP